MSGHHRYYLDEVLVSDSVTWQKLENSVKRDPGAKGIMITQDATLEFDGDGAEYIKSVRDTQGYCADIDIVIKESCNNDGNYSIAEEGKIFISDIERNRDTCRVKTKMQDNSFYAKINNNKSVEAFLWAGRSKLENDIDPCPYYFTDFFSVTTGVYRGYNYIGDFSPGVSFRLFDVLKYLVDFMTDGTVEFRSDALSVGGRYYGKVLTCGISIRSASLTEEAFQAQFPKLSWQRIFTEVAKPMNLGYWIEYEGSNPIFRVEDNSYFHSDDVVATIPKVRGVVESTNKESIYSAVKFGSAGLIVDPLLGFPETSVFSGFNEEQFAVVASCNIDSVLDLSYNLTVSSNAIEKYFGGDDSADSSLVLVDTIDGPNPDELSAKQSNWLPGGTLYYYNEFFINSNIALRYLSAVPATIAYIINNLAQADNKFRAYASAAGPSGYSYKALALTDPDLDVNGEYTLTEQLQFALDYGAGHDVSNNYGNGTAPGTVVSLANSRFTAPTGGIYQLGILNKFDLLFLHAPFINVPGLGYHATITYSMKLYDSSNTLLNTYQASFSPNQVALYTHTVTSPINMAAGDYVTAEYTLFVKKVGFGTYFSIAYYANASGSFFECSGGTEVANIYQSFDPTEFRNRQFTVKDYTSTSQWEAIKRRPNGKIAFTDSEGSVQAWIKDLKRNRLTGETTFHLFSSEKLLR